MIAWLRKFLGHDTANGLVYRSDDKPRVNGVYRG
jgi:hypothetical protein